MGTSLMMMMCWRMKSDIFFNGDDNREEMRGGETMEAVLDHQTVGEEDRVSIYIKENLNDVEVATQFFPNRSEQ